MPKGFNENEKQKINEMILTEGRKLFSSYGLKKTSIKDITSAVGIAQGSFYIFFNSKEALYFAILEQEEQKIKEHFIDSNLTKAQSPKKALKELLHKALQLVEENVFIRQIYLDNNMEAILRKLPKEALEEHFQKDSDSLLPLIHKWQNEGIILQKDPDVIAGIFRSLFLLTLHKEQIGAAVYHPTLEFLINQIVDGMVIKEDLT